MKICPVCDSNKHSLLFKIPGAVVSRCLQCTHSFSHDLKIKPEEIYRDDYFLEHHKNWFENPNYKLFKRIKNRCLENFQSKDISILDVGCGNGDFLRYLHSDGFTNLTGVDFHTNSDPNIQFATANIFEISEQTFSRKFDFVVTLATIEHVDNPTKFIEILRSVTKPNGLICIMTNDEDSLLYKLSRFAHKIGINHCINRLYDTHHLNHFSMKSLKTLIKKNKDLEILEHYSINFPLKAIDLPNSVFNFAIKPVVIMTFLITSAIKKLEFLQVITLKNS